ncbi:beta-mannosidase [Vallitalea okinawensis]|uniref:beta-mannosidase n=1 Tax=Vallitalea okinawensis TaxID=2078660 RepID=UPI000CFDA8CA|nr:glycoside hydrolase family 2 protein [Vallitalea okinawensis]
MKQIILNGEWLFRKATETEWINAEVPGSVCKDLLRVGLLENPFYRDNEWTTYEVLKNDFVYEKAFEVSQDFLTMDQLNLVCQGLDTVVDIYLNNQLLAQVDNMHRTYKFNVKDYLIAGENKIKFYFHSMINYALKKHEENPIYDASDTVSGFEQVRKAHCMYGWDWGPKLPDMGIFRDIEIVGYNQAELEDVYIVQNHEENRVQLDLLVHTKRLNNSPLNCTVNVTSPSGEIMTAVRALKEEKEKLSIEISSPELWWPNGYGQQPLYDVEVILKNEDETLDTYECRVGLRTLSVKQEKDEWGQSFEFEINGLSIFAMGANYIPEDSIITRCNKERTRKLLEQCIEVNFNCIRTWGGGYFLDDYFYELCDEMGLIVWQDLLFACAPYLLTDDFIENIKKETEDNIKRLRNHPCIGLWCGNNELEWGWTDWDMGFGTDPKLKANYIKQFEYILPEVAKEHDPNRFYWIASPSSGGSFDHPNDENRGDVHYWEVWHRLKPFKEYRKYYFRFCSEFGFQSFPCLKTVESFTLPEDRNIFSYVMENHQKNGQANGRILGYLAQTFKYPKNFDSLLYTSQLLQAEAIKYGVEHWRRNRNRCMGAIYWQLNDCWPVASWASIDYYGRWKALHYFAKRFFAPIMLSVEDTDSIVRFAVANETLDTFKGQIKWYLRKNNGEVLDSDTIDAEVKQLSSKYMDSLDFSNDLLTKEERFSTYMDYYLICDDQIIGSGSTLFTEPKYFKFLDPKISFEVIDNGQDFTLSFKTINYAKYIEIDFKDMDIVLEDNYFDMNKDIGRIINVSKDTLPENINREWLSDHICIRSIYDMSQ